MTGRPGGRRHRGGERGRGDRDGGGRDRRYEGRNGAQAESAPRGSLQPEAATADHLQADPRRREGRRRPPGRPQAQAESAPSSSLQQEAAAADHFQAHLDEARAADALLDGHRHSDFGVVVYDLETIHDAECGTYAEKGLHECAASEQILWKRRSQIIEFAAVDLHSGKRICVRSRPEFQWADVRSPAARCFAEDHGHDKIIQDESLPQFKERWPAEVLPFLKQAAGSTGRLAMIAHNGDAFDHIVLEKELVRLDLAGSLSLELHRFDTIRTLKRHYGQDYGSGGQLALKVLHAEHVRMNESGLAPHQAMDDCIMLIEVLSRWTDLGQLLAEEIATEIVSSGSNVTGGEVAAAINLLNVRFACPAHMAVKGVPPPPPPLPPSQCPQQTEVLGTTAISPVAAGAPLTLPPPPPALPPDQMLGQMRSDAMEFVPGVQWTAGTPVWGLDSSGFSTGASFNSQTVLINGNRDPGPEAPSWEPVVPSAAVAAGMQYQ